MRCMNNDNMRKIAFRFSGAYERNRHNELECTSMLYLALQMPNHGWRAAVCPLQWVARCGMGEELRNSLPRLLSFSAILIEGRPSKMRGRAQPTGVGSSKYVNASRFLLVFMLRSPSLCSRSGGLHELYQYQSMEPSSQPFTDYTR